MKQPEILGGQIKKVIIMDKRKKRSEISNKNFRLRKTVDEVRVRIRVQGRVMAECRAHVNVRNKKNKG